MNAVRAGYHEEFYELDSHDAICAGRVTLPDDSSLGFGFDFKYLNLGRVVGGSSSELHRVRRASAAFQTSNHAIER